MSIRILGRVTTNGTGEEGNFALISASIFLQVLKKDKVTVLQST